MWLQAASTGPSAGTCSRPSSRQLNHRATDGWSVPRSSWYHGSNSATDPPAWGRGYRTGVRVLAVPVKSLGRAKGRLAPVLAPPERAELVLAMLADVLDACLGQDGWTLWVVTADPRAEAVAAAHGVPALHERGTTLGEAVRQVEGEVAAGADALAVVLADLPWLHADDLRAVLAVGAPVAAAPSVDGGTNVLVRRPAGAIPARFGRASFD